MSSPSARRPRWLPLLAAFIAGMLWGAAAITPLAAQRIQTLQIEQGTLVQELVRYRGRLQRLAEEKAALSPLTIHTVDLQLTGPDAPAALKLQEALMPLLDGLEGRELDSVNPYLVHSIFDGRLVALPEGQFMVTVKYIVLSQSTYIVLTAQPVDEPAATLKEPSTSEERPVVN